MTSKPKIAIIGAKGFPAFGGSSRATESLVHILKSKYDITVYSISTHSALPSDYNGFKLIIFRGFKSKRFNTFIYYIKSLLHALFLCNYNIVQLNHLSSGFIVPFLRLRYKVIAIARGIVPENDNKWNLVDKFIFKFFSILSLYFSNIVISVSQPHIKYFEKYTNKKIHYVPNGVFITKFNDNLKHQNYLIFAAARIISLKGCHIFLEALSKINIHNPSIIIGDINHTPKYGNLLLKMSINLNVTFKELIKDKNILFNYIRHAKLFIFPSFNEGTSNMLLEVASLKTPIICSDIPENKAIFSYSEVLFFRSGNSEDLANKIKWALKYPEKMEIKANNAFQKILSNYTWDIIVQKYVKLYNSIN